MQVLVTITTSVNLIALATALWLGFYIITRSLRSMLSWLAALTLWSLAGYFLHNAIAINLPGVGVLTWLRQTVIIVLPLWFNLTVLLLAPTNVQSAHRRTAWINRVGVPLSYLCAFALVAVGLFTRELLDQLESRPAYLTDSRVPGPLYPLFIIFLAILAGLSLLNLYRGRQAVRDPILRGRFDMLLLASALAGFGGLWNSTGTLFRVDLPTLVGDIGLGAGVILLGIAVARYAALLDGRPLDRDFTYAVLVVGSLTLFYVLVVFILSLVGSVTFLSLVLTIVGTIAANSLFDGIRLGLDRVFYQRQFQQLRENLRALAREAGTGGTPAERVQAILDALCRAYRIEKGFVALRQDDHYVVTATHNANAQGQTFEAAALTANETIGLVRAEKRGLAGMTLLLPLFAGGSQTGAVVLGPKETRQPYTDPDLDLLEDLGDQLAGLIHGIVAQEENARKINALVQDFRDKERALQLQLQQMLAARVVETKPEGADEETLLPQVEDALRRLHDYSYLGEHPLSKLRIVENRAQERGGPTLTFVDRGKALSEVLMLAIDELCPDAPEPKGSQVPSREWHQFMILHDSYVEDEPNRNIMSRLYISEGTFNRTRRRALRSVAKTLAEMEVQTAQNGAAALAQ